MTKAIAIKNDIFRRSFIGGEVIITAGVREAKDKQEILTAVRTFDNFTPDNDPFLEHDFGKVVVNGESYFFKIDYYDDNYEYLKKDGRRVMTVMRADEY